MSIENRCFGIFLFSENIPSQLIVMGYAIFICEFSVLSLFFFSSIKNDGSSLDHFL